MLKFRPKERFTLSLRRGKIHAFPKITPFSLIVDNTILPSLCQGLFVIFLSYSSFFSAKKIQDENCTKR